MRLSNLAFLTSAVILSACACRLDLAGESYERLGEDTLDTVRGRIPGTRRVAGDPCAWQTIQGEQVTEAMCVNEQGTWLGAPCVDCGTQDVQHQGGSGIQFAAEPSCHNFSRYVGVCRREEVTYRYYCAEKEPDLNNPQCDGLYQTFINEY